ncbi:MAG: PDZ domain-containing protein [Longimicrobiales bacterium]
MKRVAHLRWSLFLVLSILAVPLLPLPAVAQSAEAREKQEQALRELEARLQSLAQEAQLRSAEFQEQLRATEAERRIRLEHLQQEQLARIRERERELRIRAEEVAQERRMRSEETRRRAEELAVRVRARSEAERAIREERIRDMQQVVVRMRARARLGVSLSGTQGEEFDRQGARITDVMEDSPADKAGLQEGDIITHLDGNSLLDPIPGEEDMEFGEETSLPVQRLMTLARELEDGQEVEVRYLRDGEAATVTLEAAEMDDRWVTVTPRGSRMGVYRLDPEGARSWRYAFPEDFHVQVLPHLQDFEVEIPEFDFQGFQVDSLHGWSIWKEGGPDIRVFRGEGSPGVAFIRGGEAPAFAIWGGRMHGLELRKLNPDLGEYFSADRGVLVMEVDEDSTLGLLPGDVILSIGDREVEDTADVYRILGSYEGDEAVTFTVMRKGREARVEGTMGG